MEEGLANAWMLRHHGSDHQAAGVDERRWRAAPIAPDGQHPHRSDGFCISQRGGKVVSRQRRLARDAWVLRLIR